MKRSKFQLKLCKGQVARSKQFMLGFVLLWAFLNVNSRADDLADVQDAVEETMHQQHAHGKETPYVQKMGDFFLDQVNVWDPDGHFALPFYSDWKMRNPSIWKREIKELVERNVLQEDRWTLMAKCCAEMEIKEEVDYDEKMRFFRIKIQKKMEDPTDIQFTNTIMHPSGTSSKSFFGFWARSQDKSRARVSYALSKKPWTEVFRHNMNLTKEWRYFSCYEALPANKPGEYSIRFDLGGSPGVIDIRTAIHLRVNALASYTDAQRIDTYRTGKLNIVVQDKENKPVKKVAVSLNQTRHAFHFGSNLYDFDPASHSTAQHNIQKNFKQIFNSAFIPIFWSMLEPVEGKPDYSKVQNSLNWCNENHINALGRTVLSSPFYPSWAPTDPVKIGPAIKAHVSNLISKFGDSFETIELVNDLTSSLKINQNPEGNWIRSMTSSFNSAEGPPCMALQRLLVMAREANHNKKTKFIYCCDDAYNLENFLAYKQSFGSMPDAVAVVTTLDANFQPHIVDDALGNLEHFRVPIYIYACSPNTLQNSKDNPLFDRTQAALDLYRLAFSHRNCAGIYWDGLIDHPRGPVDLYGLLHSDGTPKPIYNALDNLICKEWWTKQSGTTDDTGTFSTKAFYGEYLFTIKLANGKTITKTVSFPKNPARSQTVIVQI